MGLQFRWIFLLIAFSLVSSWSFCQLEPIRERARAYAQAGDYALAAHEGRRLLHYAGGTATWQDRLFLGDCLAASGEFQSALSQYQRAAKADPLPAIMRDSLGLRAAMSAYLAGLPGEAQTILENFRNTWQDPSLKREAVLLEAIILNDAGDFGPSRDLLVEEFKQDSTVLFRIDSVYEAALNFKPKKEGLAMVLSVILPGSGQAYGGKPGDGLISLGLTGGTAALGVVSFIQGHYAFAILTCALLFQKFYEGGARYARNLVQQHNENRIVTIRRNLNGFLMDLGDQIRE